VAWIESHQDLRDHPKTIRLADILGIQLPTAIGMMHGLWWWALSYAQDGDITDYAPSLIAKAMMWDGDPDQLIQALVDCGRKGHTGFLEMTDDGRLLIHDWYDYAGKLIEKRKEDAERKRSKRQQSECPQDVQRTSNGHPTPVAGTVPNRTVPNRTEPKNEHVAPDGAREPDEKPKAEYSPEFEQFWAVYPRKLEKREAFRCWLARLKGGAKPDGMIAAAKNYAIYCERHNVEMRFVKHASTFLGPSRPFEEYVLGPPDERGPNRNPGNGQVRSFRDRREVSRAARGRGSEQDGPAGGYTIEEFNRRYPEKSG
jgi:hypothetical protein